MVVAQEKRLLGKIRDVSGFANHGSKNFAYFVGQLLKEVPVSHHSFEGI